MDNEQEIVEWKNGRGLCNRVDFVESGGVQMITRAESFDY